MVPDIDGYGIRCRSSRRTGTGVAVSVIVSRPVYDMKYMGHQPDRFEPGMLFIAPIGRHDRVWAFRLNHDIDADADPEDISGQHVIWVDEGDKVFAGEGFTCFLTSKGLRMINKFDLSYVEVTRCTDLER